MTPENFKPEDAFFLADLAVLAGMAVIKTCTVYRPYIISFSNEGNQLRAEVRLSRLVSRLGVELWSQEGSDLRYDRKENTQHRFVTL